MGAGRVASRVALVLVGVVVALGAAEVALRAAGVGERPTGLRGLHEVRPDRPWLYGLKPGATAELEVSDGILYQISPEGFRDRSHTREVPPGAFRILVLGDSIAFGYGVAREQSFPALLETLAAERMPAARIEVLNFGVSGYNPYNEAAQLADIGVDYSPDLVLVQFCVNDLNDPTLHFDASTHLALETIPDTAFPDPATRPRSETLRDRADGPCARSRLCSLIRDRIGPDWGGLTEESWALAFEPRAGDADEIAWSWLDERYREIAATAAEVDARFAVIAVPYRAQLDDPERDALQRRLLALGRAGGWETIDLLPGFRRAAANDPEPLFTDLWHPSARGHRVAAREILAELACAGLVPAQPGADCAPERSGPERR